MYGEYAVVGAVGKSNFTGSAYVFIRSGTTWTEQAILTASDATAGDYFGEKVAIYGDYIVVSAYQDTHSSQNDAGSAYVFIRSGTSWSQQAKLIASDPAETDYFGTAVSIYGDYIVVGAWGENVQRGAAYVFKRNGTTWTEQAKLTASDAANNDKFGISVSLYDNYLLVGSYQDDDTVENSGSVYVFTRSGTTWTQQTKLTASDPGNNDRFGISVSLYNNFAVIGAYQDDVSSVSDVGSGYIFKRSGTSWSQEAKLTASDGAANDRFGSSVCINKDHICFGAGAWNSTEATSHTGAVSVSYTHLRAHET